MTKTKEQIIKDQESIGNIQITRDEYGSLNVEGEFMIWTKTGCLYFKPKPEDKRVFEKIKTTIDQLYNMREGVREYHLESDEEFAENFYKDMSKVITELEEAIKEAERQGLWK